MTVNVEVFVLEFQRHDKPFSERERSQGGDSSLASLSLKGTIMVYEFGQTETENITTIAKIDAERESDQDRAWRLERAAMP